MKFVADVHLHSHYSRATSKNLNLEHLTTWAQIKGVEVVGTGDIAHPGWLQEMKEKLEPAEEGLFRLKEEFLQSVQEEVPKACHGRVRFMLAGEISNIYKKNNKVRKIHNVCFAPSFEALEKLQTELEKIGNIRSDGRPILGLPSRDLLELILEVDPECHLIPAHIWTPWFALFGSKSGYDSIEECFEDLTPHIFALETGLSSDPPMNWRLSALDNYTLVSNSDAHSPQKLAREANLFDTELSYPAFFDALKTGDPESFLGTIEFFPEEGKYHYDGHRKCEISWEPKTTKEHGGVCPVCGKQVTVGVLHRVDLLADREEGVRPENAQSFTSLIPLPEILAQVYGVGVNSKRVQKSFEGLLAALGPELSILQEIPPEEIEQVGGPLLAEGIRRMRSGQITIEGGYDGEYGTIKLFEKSERDSLSGQSTLFALELEKGSTKETQEDEGESIPAGHPPERVRVDIAISPLNEEEREADRLDTNTTSMEDSVQRQSNQDSPPKGLNSQQQEAVSCTDRSVVIVAGPGTGKTRTLTHRIAHVVKKEDVAPENILAITFTNKGAEEMQRRLETLLKTEVAAGVTIKTFHSFGAMVLRAEADRAMLDNNFAVCSESDRRLLFKMVNPDVPEKEVDGHLDHISWAKNHLLTTDSPGLVNVYRNEFIEIYKQYEKGLRERGILDFDDLIVRTVDLLERHSEIRVKYQDRFRWISVDEYQDVNMGQYRLLKVLVGSKTNLCAIGDPDQAIYGFRGANREYFLRFRGDFPDAFMLHLHQNYRSTQPILEASSQVIAEGKGPKGEELCSEIVGKAKLQMYRASTYKAEAEYVVHTVERMVGGTSYFSLDSGRVTTEEEKDSRPFSDFAVLYRLGALSKPLEEAFERSGIPYQTVGGKALREYKEIQQILTYLRLIHDVDSRFHQEVLEASDMGRSASPGDIERFLHELREKAGIDRVSSLTEHVSRFINPEDTGDGAGKRTERVERLLRKANGYENRLGEFLEAMALQKEGDEYDPRADRVTLMTLHASKGLEFPVVFIVGCEEKLVPYQKGEEEPDIEEERRLMYVGMTRAQERLILTHADKRFLYGRTMQNSPSRFLNNIEDALKELEKAEPTKKQTVNEPSPQLELF